MKVLIYKHGDPIHCFAGDVAEVALGGLGNQYFSRVQV